MVDGPHNMVPGYWFFVLFFFASVLVQYVHMVVHRLLGWKSLFQQNYSLDVNYSAKEKEKNNGRVWSGFVCRIVALKPPAPLPCGRTRWIAAI